MGFFAAIDIGFETAVYGLEIAVVDLRFNVEDLSVEVFDEEARVFRPAFEEPTDFPYLLPGELAGHRTRALNNFVQPFAAFRCRHILKHVVSVFAPGRT